MLGISVSCTSGWRRRARRHSRRRRRRLEPRGMVVCVKGKEENRKESVRLYSHEQVHESRQKHEVVAGTVQVT